jgi:hypothetical protein
MASDLFHSWSDAPPPSTSRPPRSHPPPCHLPPKAQSPKGHSAVPGAGAGTELAVGAVARPSGTRGTPMGCETGNRAAGGWSQVSGTWRRRAAAVAQTSGQMGRSIIDQSERE